MEQFTYPAPEKMQKEKFSMSRSIRRLALGATLLGMVGCSLSEKGENSAERKVLSEFKLENSFPVDEASLRKENLAEIQNNMNQFLEAYNTQEKFLELLQARIVIECSSDERPTSSWGVKGNEALSHARLVTLDSLMHIVINNFSYNADIAPEDVHRFKGKTYIKRIPAGAWGKGFIPLTQIENPSTGRLFTEQEVRQLSADQKQELYDATRYANVIFEIPGESEKEDQYDRLSEIITNYDQVTLLLDKSDSMEDDYRLFARKIKENVENNDNVQSTDTIVAIPFEREAFSDEQKAVPFAELPATLESLSLYGGDEKVVLSIQQSLENMQAKLDQRQALIALTDEGIQDFSVAALGQLSQQAKEKNCDVYFGLLSPERIITLVDIPGLEYEIDRFVDMFVRQESFFEPTQSHELRTEMIRSWIDGVQLDEDGNILVTISGESLYPNIRSYFYEKAQKIKQQYTSGDRVERDLLLDENDQEKEEAIELYDYLRTGRKR
ncbi:MAG: hypothetical protein KBC22_00045 [Candidatus Pacebacteria bacterium]|nr:hypothetical protein [Candidatus Paceibacterota bacterium]